jgi:hypothetical protein
VRASAIAMSQWLSRTRRYICVSRAWYLTKAFFMQLPESLPTKTVAENAKRKPTSTDTTKEQRPKKKRKKNTAVSSQVSFCERRGQMSYVLLGR